MLDPRLNFAHSVWLTQEEIELLAEHGAGVVLNPQGNLKMKCGIAPIRVLQNAGVRIGLGCDNCSCSDAQNMFVAMKLFTLLGCGQRPDPRSAAGDCGIARRHRSRRRRRAARQHARPRRARLQSRPDADRYERPDVFADEQRARQLVHIEAGRGVRHVICDGKIVVRDRQLTTVDETTIYEAVKAVMPEFRRDFSAISQRVAKLQPWLDRAHREIMAAELDIDRLPFGSH